jgi:hypothetical protein
MDLLELCGIAVQLEATFVQDDIGPVGEPVAQQDEMAL